MMCNMISVNFSIKKIFIFITIFLFIKSISSKSIQRYNECDLFLNLNDCYYFACLEAHYPCGPHGPLIEFSYNFCLLTSKIYSSRLTTNGSFYFNHTNQCAMKSLHEQLIEEKISAKFTCTDLQIFIYKIYLDCFQNISKKKHFIKIMDFCSIICNDLQTVIDLFLNLNIDDVKLHELLIRTGKTCGADINQSISHTVSALLISICLDRKNTELKQDISLIMFNQRYETKDYEWI